jgi:hypothetical protein
MGPVLTLRAGPDAAKLIRERGLRPQDIDIVPGASGGPKWLVLGGLDRYLFGDFLQHPRSAPLLLVGSSIGSWRMACLAQRRPIEALTRGHQAYIREQQYSAKPTAREVSDVLGRALDQLLGPDGVTEILSHPWARLHIITAQRRGIAASQRRSILGAALAIAALGNLASRRTLGLHMRRCVFYSGDHYSRLARFTDLPTTGHPLTRENLRAALLASGSIPLVMEGVTIPGRPGEIHWDGGLVDYHPDLAFGDGDGLVLYPHFYPHIVPGWFDKRLTWRRGGGANSRRSLLIAPSAEFVASLPNGRIPDRDDFLLFDHATRIRHWETTLDASERLGDELRELVTTGRVADRLEPL